MRRGWWEKELAERPPVPEVVARPLILPLTMGSILAGVDPSRSHNLSWGAFWLSSASRSQRCRRQSVVVFFVNPSSVDSSIVLLCYSILLSSDSSIHRLSIRQSSSVNASSYSRRLRGWGVNGSHCDSRQAHCVLLGLHLSCKYITKTTKQTGYFLQKTAKILHFSRFVVTFDVTFSQNRPFRVTIIKM